MRNKEGYLDPTASEALSRIYHSHGKLDYTKFASYDELIDYTLECHPALKGRKEAESYIREHMPKESYFQRKIMDWIDANIKRSIVWKEAAGPYSRQGIPDITCIVNGRYYGFEVKRPFIGILSKIQEQTIKAIREAGGRAYVVTSVQEVAKILLPEIIGARKRDAGRKGGENDGCKDIGPKDALYWYGEVSKANPLSERTLYSF